MMMIPHARKHPFIVAHRGARDEAPENTGAAFDAALSYPIDGIELDVQMTRDGVPVVYHDRSLYRICGKRRPLDSVDATELFAMDGGRWFKAAFAGESLLSLEAVLVRYIHRTRLLVEIKSRPRDRRNGRALELTRKTVSLFTTPSIARYMENLFLLSFDPAVLREAARLLPAVKRVWNMPDTAGEFQQASEELRSAPSQIHHLDGLCVKLNRLTAEITALARNQKKLLFTYTCNGPGPTRKAMDMGVDLIMTDRPGWMMTFLRESSKK